MGLMHFQECDYVFLECGLGGRLDATNVIQNPLATVITSIGLDHTRILGDSISAIAQEKAGIIKPNSPTFVGVEQDIDAHAFEVIKQRCEEVGSELHRAKLTSSPDFNVRNSNLALEVIEQIFSPMPAMESMLLLSNQPCRYERYSAGQGVDIVFDAAHNKPGLEALLSRIQGERASKVHVVFASSADKKLDVDLISQLGEEFYLCPAQTTRAAAPSDLQDQFPSTTSTQVFPSVTDAVMSAQIAAIPGDLVLVCGSLYMMSEARAACGIEEPRDEVLHHNNK